MAHSVYGREKADVEFNMTPMIDVTFQLIIFFILAGSFASLEFIRMTVPELWAESLLMDLERPNRVVVNLPAYPEEEIKKDDTLKGKVQHWKVEEKTWPRRKPGRRRDLLTFLQNKKNVFESLREDDSLEFEVYLRAEHTVNSGEVMEVLGVIKEAGYSKVYYVASSKEQGGR